MSSIIFSTTDYNQSIVQYLPVREEFTTLYQLNHLIRNTTRTVIQRIYRGFNVQSASSQKQTLQSVATLLPNLSALSLVGCTSLPDLFTKFPRLTELRLHNAVEITESKEDESNHVDWTTGTRGAQLTHLQLDSLRFICIPAYIWTESNFGNLQCLMLDSLTARELGRFSWAVFACKSLKSLKYRLDRTVHLPADINDMVPCRLDQLKRLEYLHTCAGGCTSLNSIDHLPDTLKTLFYTGHGISQQDSSVTVYPNLHFLHLSFTTRRGLTYQINLLLPPHLKLFPNLVYLTIRCDANYYPYHQLNIDRGVLFLKNHNVEEYKDVRFPNALQNICTVLKNCSSRNLQHLKLLLDVTCYFKDQWSLLAETINNSLPSLQSLTLQLYVPLSTSDELKGFVDLDRDWKYTSHSYVDQVAIMINRLRDGLLQLNCFLRDTVSLYLSIDSPIQPDLFYSANFEDVFQQYLLTNHPLESRNQCIERKL